MALCGRNIRAALQKATCNRSSMGWMKVTEPQGYQIPHLWEIGFEAARLGWAIRAAWSLGSDMRLGIGPTQSSSGSPGHMSGCPACSHTSSAGPLGLGASPSRTPLCLS